MLYEFMLILTRLYNTYKTVSVASKRDGRKPLNVFCFALVAGGD